MKAARLIFALALVLALSLPALAAAPQWSIDPPHCQVIFTIKHVFAPVMGQFHKFGGKIFFNPEVSGHFGPSKSQNRPYSIRASGSYQRSGDHIDLYYSSPGWTPSTIVHELGHRYWAKFMSAEDKHRFEQFFGKAKAASDYGMTNPEEDFCELFAAYVIGREWSKAGGKNLDRYQRQRMEAFLGKKRKLESVSTTLHDSLLEAIAMQRA